MYTSERGGINNIYIMNADGTNQQPLTSNTDSALEYYALDLSPTGDQVAFDTYGALRNPGGIVNVDGSGVVLLPGPDEYSFWSWSPDGRQLTTAVGGRVWVVNADGSDAHELKFTFPE